MKYLQIYYNLNVYYPCVKGKNKYFFLTSSIPAGVFIVRMVHAKSHITLTLCGSEKVTLTKADHFN